jgi:anti-sigma regulatory factor (Ser/Thr protein kinase)
MRSLDLESRYSVAKFAVRLASTDQAAHQARAQIRERFAEVIPASTLWDLLTVVTELVTNAVRHGHGDTVRIRLIVGADGTVSGEVENDGHGRVEPRPLDMTGTGGMGLHIVDAIADRWRVLAGSSTRVRFELSPP